MDDRDLQQTLNSEEFGNAVFNNLLDTFVTPEVERRQEAGEIEKPLNLIAFQIIFFPDDRLHEVRILAKPKYKDGVTKHRGDAVFEHEIESLGEFFLTNEDDPDCGYVVFVKIHDKWAGYFDFRYNQRLVKRHVEAAEEFYQAAKYSFDLRNWSAFVDNLFSAVELAAKATLLPHYVDLRNSKRHQAVRTRYNLFASHGNVKPIYKDTLNRLSHLRFPARYLSNEVNMSDEDAEALLQTVREMIDEAEHSIRQKP